MRKDTFYLIIIVVLLSLNLAALFFLLRRSDRPPVPGNVKFDRLIERELELTPQQLEVFDRLKREHHEQMLALDGDMKAPFELYFSLIPQEGREAQKDSLEQVLSAIYKQKAKVTFEHFRKLYNICTEYQKKKFKRIIPHLLQVIGPPHRQGGSPMPPEERGMDPGQE